MAARASDGQFFIGCGSGGAVWLHGGPGLPPACASGHRPLCGGRADPDGRRTRLRGTATQTLVADQDIPAQWWSLFHSEPLDALVRTALHDSPTIAAAAAALRSAHEGYVAQRGSSLYPQVDGQFQAEREAAPGCGVRLAAARHQHLYPVRCGRERHATSLTWSEARAANWRRWQRRRTISAGSSRPHA